MKRREISIARGMANWSVSAYPRGKVKKKFLAKDSVLRVNAIGVNLSRSASSGEQEKLRTARFQSSQCHSTRSCHDPDYDFSHPSRQTSLELRQHLMLQSEMKRLSQSAAHKEPRCHPNFVICQQQRWLRKVNSSLILPFHVSLSNFRVFCRRLLERSELHPLGSNDTTKRQSNEPLAVKDARSSSFLSKPKFIIAIIFRVEKSLFAHDFCSLISKEIWDYFLALFLASNWLCF